MFTAAQHCFISLLIDTEESWAGGEDSTHFYVQAGCRAIHLLRDCQDAISLLVLCPCDHSSLK